jgi:hypothetical protein
MVAEGFILLILSDNSAIFFKNVYKLEYIRFFRFSSYI